MRKQILLIILLAVVLPMMAQEAITDTTVVETPQITKLEPQDHLIHFRGQIIFGGQINLQYSDIVLRSTDEAIVEWMKTMSLYQFVRNYGMLEVASAEVNTMPVPPPPIEKNGGEE